MLYSLKASHQFFFKVGTYGRSLCTPLLFQKIRHGAMPNKKGQVFYTPVLLFKKQTWLVENCFKRKEGKLFQETWVKKYFLMSFYGLF